MNQGRKRLVRSSALAIFAAAVLYHPVAEADDAYSAITQDGHANFGAIEQFDASGSIAQIYQSGTGNAAGSLSGDDIGIFTSIDPGIFQTHVFNADAYVFQGGNGNGVSVFQGFGANSKVVISQGGAFIDFETGTFIDGGPSFGSYAGAVQHGFDNDIRILQYGTGNVATATQIGQGGDPNVSRITQLGRGLIGGTTQYGTGNRASILQH